MDSETQTKVLLLLGDIDGRTRYLVENHRALASKLEVHHERLEDLEDGHRDLGKDLGELKARGVLSPKRKAALAALAAGFGTGAVGALMKLLGLAQAPPNP